MPYSHPQPLRREHDRERFACGEPELDRWLADHALGAQASGSARVFASIDGRRIVGYYALAAAQLQPEVLSDTPFEHQHDVQRHRR